MSYHRLLTNDSTDDGNEGDNTWVIGVILCLAGSISLNFGNNLQSLGLQGITEPISGDAANDVKPSSKAPTSTLPSPNPNEGNRGVVAGASVDRSLDSIQQPTFAALPVKSAGLPQPGNSPNKVIDGRDSHRMYDKTVALIDEENFEETHKQKTSMHNPRLFYLGTALFVSGSLLTFASFGFAAQSLLASLEGVQFVSNVVFAKLIRKQPVTLPVLLGVSMIVLGVATVVLVGDHSSEVYSVRHLTRLYVENHAYQVFLVVAGGSAVVLRYTERAYSKRAAQGRPWPYSSTVIPVTYAAFSAIFGTQSVVQAKCLMMALSLTANGDNQFNHGIVYAMLGWWAVSGYVWLNRMGKALKRFDPMFIIPLLQVDFILLAIVSGGIYFQEFDGFRFQEAAGFVSGVLFVCGGLYCLAPKQAEEEDQAGAAVASSSGDNDTVLIKGRRPKKEPLSEYEDDNYRKTRLSRSSDSRWAPSEIESADEERLSTSVRSANGEARNWLMSSDEGISSTPKGGANNEGGNLFGGIDALTRRLKSVQTVAFAAAESSALGIGDVFAAVGSAVADDLRELGHDFSAVARGDPLSVFATHEPSVWLQVNKTTGEVDWRATTAKLNLLSAAQLETESSNYNQNSNESGDYEPRTLRRATSTPVGSSSVENPLVTSNN